MSNFTKNSRNYVNTKNNNYVYNYVNTCWIIHWVYQFDITINLFLLLYYYALSIITVATCQNGHILKTVVLCNHHKYQQYGFVWNIIYWQIKMFSIFSSSPIMKTTRIIL